MEAHLQTVKSALDNQVFSLLARLHVIFRREINRITDIEYMRVSPEYCRYILNLAAQSTIPDLQQIAVKLDALFFGPTGLFVRFPEKLPPAKDNKETTVQAMLVGVQSTPSAAVSNSSATFSRSGELDSASVNEVAYVGRLR